MQEKWIIIFSSKDDPSHAWAYSNPTNETLYFHDANAAMESAGKEALSMFNEPVLYHWVAVKLQNIEEV